jgi:hydroxyacylglutathione hydrolase
MQTTPIDQVGDIIFKACTLERIDYFAASLAAEIPWDEFLGLIAPEREKREWRAERANLQNLAAVLGLDPSKLVRMATYPSCPGPCSPGDWRELRTIATKPADPGGHGDQNWVNAYLVWDAATKEAALFDTGWDAAPIIDAVAAANVNLSRVFLTHAHKAHTGGLAGLLHAYPRITVHGTPECSQFGASSIASGRYSLGSLEIECRATEGHSDVDVIYVVSGWDERPPIAVVGDTLLAGSLAFAWHSWSSLKTNVREQILTLDRDTLVCPGHGPLTTVGHELAVNPFF